MAERSRDIWAEWLLRRGTAGDKEGWVNFLRPVRDRVLDNAALADGDTLLDVGAGDGMIAFGALERLGEGGRVDFADVSKDLLDHSRALAEEKGVADRCSFLLAPATDLSQIGDGSVDAVTTRSVLIYVRDKRLARYFLNSLLISLGATVISVFVAILAAYAISRYRFSGRGVFSLIVLSTQMFPGILFLLPLFVLYVNLERALGIQLYGSYAGLIITYLTFALPFSIWMLVGYFDSIPRELEQAAMVDGTSALGALFRVLVPVSMPGIVAVAIFAFITAWGEVLFASVLTDDATRTLAVGLRNYAIQSNVYWNQLMAAAIVVSIPVVAGFLALQRYLVQGIAAGGVKG
jgi:multiple sugar transport system permease protein